MVKLTRRHRAALDAVARHVAANVNLPDRDWPAAYLTLAKKRIAVDIAALKPSHAGMAKPRLRFDKVVLRLVADVQAALADIVPNGVAVIFTLTAPIRLPAKTADELVSRVRGALTRRSAKVEIEETIHGNRARIRLVKCLSTRGANVIGFVHNPAPESGLILDVTQSLLQLLDRADDAAASRRTDERWLVLVAEDGLPASETYRQIYARLPGPSPFAKVFMVHPDGRIETIAP